MYVNARFIPQYQRRKKEHKIPRDTQEQDGHVMTEAHIGLYIYRPWNTKKFHREQALQTA
jgi:hypothetical protein